MSVLLILDLKEILGVKAPELVGRCIAWCHVLQPVHIDMMCVGEQLQSSAGKHQGSDERGDGAAGVAA